MIKQDVSMKIGFGDSNVLQIFTDTIVNKYLAAPEPGSYIMGRQPRLTEWCRPWTSQNNSVLPFIVFYVGKGISTIEYSFPNCKMEIILAYEFCGHYNINC